MTKYDASSINKLTFREAVRKNVGMYLGSSDSSGVMAGFLELVNNATDEFLQKKEANKIEITVFPNKIEIRDYGRGMPHGPNAYTEEVMIDLLTENHSGGKFDEKAYGGKSRGLHGTGAGATCCSSDYFKIISYRDGHGWLMEFEEGIPLYPVCEKLPIGKEKEGTYIEYSPSQEVFASEEINIKYNDVCNEMEEYSFFNKGIAFIVTNGLTGEVKSYLSKNGLLDFAKKIINEPIHKPLHLTKTENDIDVELILQWTKNDHEYHLFSNGGKNPDGGTPITGIKTALTLFFKKHIEDKHFNPDLARNGLVVICSIHLKNPLYDGQTKTKIRNPELRGLVQRCTSELLNDFAETPEFAKLLDFLERESRAEQAAIKAKQTIRENTKEINDRIKSKVQDPGKLKDARNLGKDAILLISEGDSATGLLSSARDPNRYGILSVKGKMINPLTNKIEEVYKNEEIKLLFSALGIVPGKYNSKKLRYGKVAIATDADADGEHIALLVLTIFRELMPEMLKENRVVRLESPTHIIEHNGKSTYIFNESELDEHRNKKGHLKIIKGLGELKPLQAKESMFGPMQRITTLTWSDELNMALGQLMGKDVSYRKDFLFNKIDFSKIKE